MPTFPLLEELAALEWLQWILVAALALVAVFAAVWIARHRQGGAREKTTTAERTRALVYGALCVALSFVLSYIRILKMPQGGAITLGSMLPVILYAHWYGPRNGFIAAFAYGLLQFVQDPYFLNVAQFMLDYLLGFGALGLASLFRRLPVAVAVSGAARLLCSFLSGVIFFGEFAPEGMSPVLYSLGYQFSSIGLDTVVCVVLAVLLQRAGVLARLRPRNLALMHKANEQRAR